MLAKIGWQRRRSGRFLFFPSEGSGRIILTLILREVGDGKGW